MALAEKTTEWPMTRMQTLSRESTVWTSALSTGVLACTLLHTAHGDLPLFLSLSVCVCNALIKHAHWVWIFLPSEHTSLLQTQGVSAKAGISLCMCEGETMFMSGFQQCKKTSSSFCLFNSPAPQPETLQWWSDHQNHQQLKNSKTNNSFSHVQRVYSFDDCDHSYS